MKITTDELNVLLGVIQRSPISLAEKLVIERVLTEITTAINAEEV